MRALPLFTAMLFISISGFPAPGNSFDPSKAIHVKDRVSNAFYLFNPHYRFKDTDVFPGVHYHIKAYLSDGSVANTK